MLSSYSDILIGWEEDGSQLALISDIFWNVTKFYIGT